MAKAILACGIHTIHAIDRFTSREISFILIARQLSLSPPQVSNITHKRLLRHRKLYILEEKGKTIMKKKSEKLTDLCGCVWEIQEGIWVCVKRCPKHSKPKSKRPYRSKAESVRSGGKFD